MSLNSVTARWLGHSTFLVTSPEGFRIIIDPWLKDNPACPADAGEPEPVDLILATHAHSDHIGGIVSLAARTGAPVVAIHELALWLGQKGILNTKPMNKGGTQAVGPVKVTMVHADHSSSILDGGQVIYAGEAAGYIIHFSNGYRLWHMGDTAVFGDMALIADIYKPDAVMLPIGDHYAMSVEEASHAVRLTGIRKIIPMHFGTFPLLSGSPEELRRLCADTPGVQILEMKPGDTVRL